MQKVITNKENVPKRKSQQDIPKPVVAIKKAERREGEYLSIRSTSISNGPKAIVISIINPHKRNLNMKGKKINNSKFAIYINKKDLKSIKENKPLTILKGPNNYSIFIVKGKNGIFMNIYDNSSRVGFVISPKATERKHTNSSDRIKKFNFKILPTF